MAPVYSTLVISLLMGLASAQGLAKKTMEVHPELTTYECTLKSGCKAKTSYIVLDSDSHPIYQKANPSMSCTNGSAPADVCQSKRKCADACVIDGISDYASMGVTTSTDALRLDMLRDSDLSTLSPRVYLLDENEREYDMMKLTGMEFTFDVDVSKLPCGMNGALYFSEMNKNGGKSSLNKAGAAYGAGYCDAQCFKKPFFEGVANPEQAGACCPELDIWEANSRATSLAPHPCNVRGSFPCEGVDCTFDGVCDQWGCVMNPYGNGDKDFYSRGAPMGVDTTKPFTVVTQFPADSRGRLASIHRLYVQNGKVIQEPTFTKAGLPSQNYMTDDYCQTTGGAANFLKLGGMTEMGHAMSRGMVLAMSIWWDQGGFMNWLDSTDSGTGPCNATEGNPAVIAQIQPDVAVTFSKIKLGEIGSTYM